MHPKNGYYVSHGGKRIATFEEVWRPDSVGKYLSPPRPNLLNGAAGNLKTKIQSTIQLYGNFR